MEGPGPILSLLRQMNAEAAEERAAKQIPTSTEQQNDALEELLYEPPSPVDKTTTPATSYSRLRVEMDRSKERSISTPRPVLNRAQEIAAQTQLENAIVRNDRVKLFRILENGCNPNPENLLARIIMCRFPPKAHQLNKNSLLMAYSYALTLIDYGARLTQTEVDGFFLFQQRLEAEFTGQEDFFSDFILPQKTTYIRDPGKLCFDKVAIEHQRTKNPYIQIILKEIHEDVYFSDVERAICQFAALIMPELLKYSNSVQEEEGKEE